MQISINEKYNYLFRKQSFFKLSKNLLLKLINCGIFEIVSSREIPEYFGVLIKEISLYPSFVNEFD